jgi:predicted DNA-binding transcriptional regulator AlpA
MRTYDRGQLAELFQCSLRTIDRLRNDPTFPRPIRASGRLVRWSAEAVERWLSQSA